MSPCLRRLKDPSEVPSRGWKALQPETDTVVSGRSHAGLLVAVARYREANGLPVGGNVRRLVEDQVCRTMAPDEAERKCVYLSENDAQNPAPLRYWDKTAVDLENFGKAAEAVIESLAKDGPAATHVPKDEAETRAGVCAQCPHNVPIANCWGCGILGALYRRLLGGKSTTKDGLLRNCGICGCDNKSQVHFSANVHRMVASKQGLTGEVFPSWCWKKEVLSP
jgi:hypothetical protein